MSKTENDDDMNDGGEELTAGQGTEETKHLATDTDTTVTKDDELLKRSEKDAAEKVKSNNIASKPGAVMVDGVAAEGNDKQKSKQVMEESNSSDNPTKDGTLPEGKKEAAALLLSHSSLDVPQSDEQSATIQSGAVAESTVSRGVRMGRSVGPQLAAEDHDSEDDDSVSNQVGAVAISGIDSTQDLGEDKEFEEYNSTALPENSVLDAKTSEDPNSNLVEARPVYESDEEDIEAPKEDNEVNRVHAQPLTEEDLKGDRGLLAWMRQHILLVSILLLVITGGVVAAVVVAVTSGGGGGADASPTTSAPTPAPGRAQVVLPTLTKLTPRSILEDPSTPQNKAWIWLAEEDEAMLDFEVEEEQRVQQRYAAALLFYAIGGPGWTRSMGFLSAASECQWNEPSPTVDGIEGIECNDDGGIIKIRFPNAGQTRLAGFLPEEFFVVSAASLTYVSLVLAPEIGGILPTSLTLATNLEDLRLFGCNLSGPLPENIGALTKVNWLALQENNLSGPIPASIGDMASLENLFLNDNNFNGMLPPEMGNLVNLRVLVLDRNEFSGSIPAEFSGLMALRTARFAENNLVDGADNLCNIPSLVSYATDCLSSVVPPIPRELTCTCCSQCCGDSEGCAPNA